MTSKPKSIVLEHLPGGAKRVQYPDGSIHVVSPNFPYEPTVPSPKGTTWMDTWVILEERNVGTQDEPLYARMYESDKHPGVYQYTLSDPRGFKSIGYKHKTITYDTFLALIESAKQRKLRWLKAQQDEQQRIADRQSRLAKKKARKKNP